MRDNPLWPHPSRSAAQGRKPCQTRDCDADTTGQRHYGHCVHCGQHVGGRTAKQWHVLVRRPCPECGRPW